MSQKILLSLLAANLSRSDAERLAITKSKSDVDYHITLPCGRRHKIENQVSSQRHMGLILAIVEAWLLVVIAVSCKIVLEHQNTARGFIACKDVIGTFL